MLGTVCLTVLCPVVNSVGGRRADWNVLARLHTRRTVMLGNIRGTRVRTGLGTPLLAPAMCCSAGTGAGPLVRRCIIRFYSGGM